MKIITIEQINSILAILGEYPAKQTFNAIAMLQNLPDSEVKESKAEDIKETE
jgi:hypothetical protein